MTTFFLSANIVAELKLADYEALLVWMWRDLYRNVENAIWRYHIKRTVEDLTFLYIHLTNEKAACGYDTCSFEISFSFNSNSLCHSCN